MLPHLPLKISHLCFHPFHHCLTPSCATCRVEKALSLSGVPPKTCPEPSKPLKLQAENLQEAGGVTFVPGDSPALPDDIDSHSFGLAGMVVDADVRELEPSSVASRGRCTSPGREYRQRQTHW